MAGVRATARAKMTAGLPRRSESRQQSARSKRGTCPSSNDFWSVGRSPRPSRSTSGSPRRSRSRSSRPTRSRPPRTRPKRSSSSSRSAPRAWRSGSTSLIPISIAVAILLAVVVTSYRQTIFAYPAAAAATSSAARTSARTPSLVAGASILVDYILTVAVSISAGVAAIVSIPAFHGLQDRRVELGLALILLISVGNLRGAQGVGPRVRGPDVLLHRDGRRCSSATACTRASSATSGTIPFDPEAADEGLKQFGGTLTLFLLLKGFSSGAVALTGIEAISDGVPAFKKPESKNAAKTLVWMAVILGTLFFGGLGARPPAPPVPEPRADRVLPDGPAGVRRTGRCTSCCRSAPRRSSPWRPTPPTPTSPGSRRSSPGTGSCPASSRNRGDRLVFSNGVLVLAGASALLIIAFGGVTTALIPLYAVGVFMSFTLSQFGMVRAPPEGCASRGYKRQHGHQRVRLAR